LTGPALALDAPAAAALGRCIARGGIALFPADTVYGLAVDPDSRSAVERLYRVKGRPGSRPAAVMYFDARAALASLSGLGPRTRAALERLLPGAVTVVVPNPERLFPLACGREPDRLGLRVPALAGALAPLAGVTRPVLQSSANVSGSREARRLEEVAPEIRARVDLEIDAGSLPGTPSTVVDLTRFEDEGAHELIREGAVTGAAVDAVLLSV
jgi:L-threonylcarbamoyladenylate synthase